MTMQLANQVNPNGYHYTNSAGDEAIITFNAVSGNIFGTLKTADGRSFSLEKCLNTHAWMEFDMKYFKPDKAIELDKPGEDIIKHVDPTDSPTNSSLVSYSVMFYYTAEFAGVTQDISGYIDQLLAETNQGYANSEVALEVTKHCSEAADIPEVEDSVEMLTAFRYMRNTVTRLRHSADAAVLLVKDLKNSCGIAFLNQISTGYTLSVVQKSCALGYYSFGHELGHNMGLNHNPEVVTNHYHPLGHGHLIQQGAGHTGYRTILAYSAPGHEHRVNYYSNPGVRHSVTGTLTGRDGVSNNAGVLIKNRIGMAAVGDEARACTLPSKSLVIG